MWQLTLDTTYLILYSSFGKQVVGEIIPLATGSQHVQDTVDDLSQVAFSVFAFPDFGWNEGFDQVPLVVGQVGRIRFAGRCGHKVLLNGKIGKVTAKFV